MSTRSSGGAGPSGLNGSGAGGLGRQLSSRATPRSMSSGALVEVRVVPPAKLTAVHLVAICVPIPWATVFRCALGVRGWMPVMFWSLCPSLQPAVVPAAL